MTAVGEYRGRIHGTPPHARADARMHPKLRLTSLKRKRKTLRAKSERGRGFDIYCINIGGADRAEA